ncbi:MAG: 2OG-Fe(II) oxygenase [Xylophilus ampelinus]
MPHRTNAARSASASAQPVTDELREWIIAQAQAGHAAPAIVDSMVQAGWQEAVAVQAMEQALRGYLDGLAVAQGQPPAVPVPEPDLSQSPLYLDAGDRRVHVLQAVAQPRIVVFGNLLSDEECEALIAEAAPRMARSLTVATKTGGEELHADRTSDGMFYARGETPTVRRLEERISRLLRWPVDHGEGLQVLRYRPGAEYKPHYDYFEPSEPGTPSILARGGQRVATLVMYLSEPAKGGGTTFPDLHLEVAPKRGNAVFFSYERPHPSTRTLHGGAPVLEGEKWIATKWLRERVFH